MTQTTFFIIKPDGMHHAEILERIVNLGTISNLKLTTLTRDKLEKHYAHIADKPFFDDIVEYMTSGPVYMGNLTCDDAIWILRQELGATDPRKAEAGTIRATYGIAIGDMLYNCVHGSDSVEAAINESQLWLD